MAILSRLKVMMFLQFFIWGCWLVTFGSYMLGTLEFSGTEVGVVYGAAGIASLFMPSLIGIIADRWVKANHIYGILHFLGAIILFVAAKTTDPDMMFWIMLAYAMAYMPTLALANTISYSSIEKAGLDTTKDFPAIRVYGTVAFILAMWTVSLGGFELSSMQMFIASGASLLLAIFSLVLPDSPTSKHVNKSQSFISRMGLDAFVLFKQKRMAIFFIFAMLLGAALQFNTTFGNPFLHDFGLNPEFKDSLVVQYPAILSSLGQISEVFFILAIPFFLRKFGIKRVMIFSMIAWVLRFGFFAYGDPSAGGFILLLLSMVVYGAAFDFFNISGSMFVEQEVDSRMRASAQGLFMTMVNGFGTYLGAVISGSIVDYFTVDGIINWQTVWLVFAGYAAILGILFAITFKEKNKDELKNKVKLSA